ncbi:MAG: hypothetical protein AAB642_03960, partial [Patescibacteria group bacterium]
MPELTREEKLKLIEKLPQRLQEFLYSEDTGAFLLYLGHKYNLPDEKVRLLSKLVADVVLGITPITSLAQEINSKIISDAQAAMNLAQELNTELLAPAMVPISTPARSVDEYREPTFSMPEIIDLRKPPPPAPMSQPKAGPPLAEKPIIPPTPITPIPPAPKPITPPLAFTRPLPTTPLIEAEPHPQYIMRPSGA